MCVSAVLCQLDGFMDCKICERAHRQFYCENCLRTHIRDYRHQTQHYATDRDGQIAKAKRALEHIHTVRIPRAHAAEIQKRVGDLWQGLSRLKKDNDRKRDRLRSLRESLALRRRTLSAATLHSPKLSPPSSGAISREAQELAALSMTISRARSGLVQELVEVFNIVEVGGRPPIGGKAGTKGEWTIGGLILPVPGDIRRYPTDHINAVLTHAIHFLSLLTFYLGIKLPFEIAWSGKKIGVGQPWIGAIRGGENGGWAKWYKKHPLHLSSSPMVSASTSPTPDPVNTGTSFNTPRTAEDSNMPLSESYVDATIEQPRSSFTTALAMLLYNVGYLAWTQNVEVPLSQAGDILSNLWSVCCSSDLGRKSHETTPLLPPPTPTSFPLDFTQLLQATSATPASRSRPSRTTSGSRSSKNFSGKNISALKGLTAREQLFEVAEEDEEGWDIIDEDGLD